MSREESGEDRMGPQGIVLLHLSDIHFASGVSGETYDPDQDLRAQLERDARVMAAEIGPPEGLLVTGDIAFAGREEEYKYAAIWLKGLCGQLGCPVESVWTVPGNHDVDRDAINASWVIQTLRSDLRSCPREEVDERIRACMNDPAAGAALFRPIANYNDFAKVFSCAVNSGRPFWQADFVLSDGSTLRLRGMNSVLTSDSLDDDGAHKLVVGSIQAGVAEEDGVTHAIMCHHPPSWLRDQDSIDDVWNNRVSIQLFGHKHRQRPFRVNESLVLVSGSAHPHRREPQWLPVYSWLRLVVDEDENGRVLLVDVYTRVWSSADARFESGATPEGNRYKRYRLRLPPWAIPARPRTDGREIGVDRHHNLGTSGSDDAKREPAGRSTMDSARILTYRFLSLPFHVRVEIANKLRLLEEADSKLEDIQLFSRIFSRAGDRRLLASLWEAVEDATGVELGSGNPFEGK